jgi:hypothetical protein
MEARVDLRTSELVVGRTRYPLQGFEAKIGEESSRQPHLRSVKSRTGPATPEKIIHGEEADSSPSQGRSREHPDGVWNVMTSESTILHPMSQVLVVAKIKGKKGMHFPEEVITEPRKQVLVAYTSPRIQ